MIRATVAATSAASASRSSSAPVSCGVLRASEDADGGPTGGLSRVGSSAMYGGWEGTGSGVSSGSLMSAPNVVFTHSMTGSTVRKLAVSSTVPPPAPKRSAAERNVEMSARRKR